MFPTQFSYTLTTQQVLFGVGSVAQLANAVAAQGWQRILVCTSRSQEHNGNVTQVVQALGPCEVVVLAETQAHVPAAQVEAGLILVREQQVQAVLGLGGGSAIGLAKAISFKHAPRLTCIAIPTTYAGSEMTPVFGITTATATGPRKITTRHPQIAPALVVYDPQLTLDLPAAITATTAINALAHGVEALYSPTRHPLSSAVAEAGLRHLGRALLPCYANGSDIAARTELLLGAHLLGAALATVEMALHHGVCHVLGGSAGVAHGAANCIVLPHALRFNEQVAAPFLARASEALGGPPTAAGAVAQVETLLAALNVPRRLRDVGVQATALPQLATEVFSSQTVQNNPRRFAAVAEAEAFLQALW